MNSEVELYFQKSTRWNNESKGLRHFFLKTELKEELKWGCPCYTLEGKNVALIHGFKNYCAILFFKGALLKDKEKLLIQQTQNVNSSRQLRFTSISEIRNQETIIIKHIQEAIKIEKAGLKVLPKKISDYPMPEEFSIILKKQPKIQKAFNALTPGRQRGYLLFFASAKQSDTRQNRINSSINAILKGKGLND